MCGRFALTTPQHVIEATFGVELGELEAAQTPRYNIAPSQEVLTVAMGRDGRRCAIPMRWGLIPRWSRDGKAKGTTINARLERAASSPTYRDSLRRWRCLIPASGFYEWHDAHNASAARKPVKQPYWIAPEDGELVAFAGLYAAWREKPKDPWLLSCAILTEPAAGDVERVHDRMPVVVAPYCWQAWIDRDMQDRNAARALLERDPRPLRLRAVSTRVNSPRNDGPELLEEELT